jgi:hypothetical protein
LDNTALELVGVFATFGLPLVGVLSYFRGQLSRLDQKIEELNIRVIEHRSNTDAHVTREWIQDLGSRIGGPSDREWGEYVNEIREIRHDLRNLSASVRLLEDK